MSDNQWPSFAQLPLHFDAEKMRQDVFSLNPELWQKHFNTQVYTGDWRGLALRALPGASTTLFAESNVDADYLDTVHLQNAGYLSEVLSHFACKLNSVRLLSLAPGAVIKHHRDYGLGPEDGEVRIHIPIQTHEQVHFYLEEQRIPMAEGQTWFLNFNRFHRVDNFSPVTRIHLVLDCMMNPWLTELIKTAGAATSLRSN